VLVLAAAPANAPPHLMVCTSSHWSVTHRHSGQLWQADGDPKGVLGRSLCLWVYHRVVCAVPTKLVLTARLCTWHLINQIVSEPHEP